MPKVAKKYLEENRRDEWVNKVCVPIVVEEGTKRDKAIAKCYGIWELAKKGDKKWIAE
ncbi:MAG: hypothetical protein ACOC4Y_01415 [bacterium]